MLTLNPTDIRQFLYCPRIIYFTYVLPVRRLPTLKMRAGADIHQLEADADSKGRRSRGNLPAGKRRYGVRLESLTLGLRGKLDMLIDSPDHGLIPVELKPGRKLEVRHQYQLVAYAMLVADVFKQPVPDAYIYSLATRRSIQITIGDEQMSYVRDISNRMRRLIDSESFPEPTRGRGGAKCHDCEYRRYCGDQ